MSDERTMISTRGFTLPTIDGIALAVQFNQEVSFEKDNKCDFIEMTLLSDDPKCINAPEHKINLRKSELIKILQFLTSE